MLNVMNIDHLEREILVLNIKKQILEKKKCGFNVLVF